MIAARRFYVYAQDCIARQGPWKWVVYGFNRAYRWEFAQVYDTKREARDRCHYLNKRAQAELRKKKARPAPKSAPKETEEAQKHLTTATSQNLQS